jgi:hypothetical protein
MGQNLQPAVDATGSPLLRTAEKQEGHLSVWNLKTFQRLHSLPLGTEPPPMNAIAFNHNGKIIAAGSGDGMVRLFDMGGRSPIMGWPSHPHASMCSICFGPDQNSIFRCAQRHFGPTSLPALRSGPLQAVGDARSRSDGRAGWFNTLLL